MALGATAAVLAAAQDQPPQPTFRTEANYVRVDVYPTIDGAPATDLRQEDFEVVEDRVLQKVEQFEHIVIRSDTGGEGSREPNTVEESRQAVTSPETRRLHVFHHSKHIDRSA